jgi:hypothetical protein
LTNGEGKQNWRGSKPARSQKWPAGDGLAALLAAGARGLNRARGLTLPETQARVLVGDLQAGAVWIDAPPDAGARARAPKVRDLHRAANVMTRLLTGRCVACGDDLQGVDRTRRQRGPRVYCGAHSHLAAIGGRPPEIEAARRLLERAGAALMRLPDPASA